jgi:hypothetical protein
VGAGIARLGQKLGKLRGSWVVAATAVLVAGVLPGTVSHLSDGTRFDYRPAFAYIEQAGSSHLILGNPDTMLIAMQRYYAPNLQLQGLRNGLGHLEEAIVQNNHGFWVIASYRRYGMIGDSNEVIEGWLDTHCRVVLRTQRPRLDYRTYRVELNWCGTSPPPR